MDSNYNKRCQAQSTGVNTIIYMMDKYLKDMMVTKPPNFADYGCGPGANTVEPLKKAVSMIAGSSSGSKIYLMDAQTKDDLWEKVQNLITKECPDIGPVTIRSSFYVTKARCPAMSLDVGWSSFAAHWLAERCPVNLMKPQPPQFNAELDVVKFPTIANQLCPNNVVSRAWSKQALECLTHFLMLRSYEFREGGVLILNICGLENSYNCAYNIFNIMSEVKMEMYRKNMITYEQCCNIQARFYLRQKPEVEASLARVSSYWKVLEHSLWNTPCPYTAGEAHDDMDGDISDQIVDSHRGYFGPTVTDALKDKKLEDYFWNDMKTRASMMPLDQLSWDLGVHTIVVSRTSKPVDQENLKKGS